LVVVLFQKIQGSALIEDLKALAASMMNIYGQDAEHETRKYAEMLKDRGSRQYAIWVEAADIIARRQKLLKTLDA
jgi:hypothetical protein